MCKVCTEAVHCVALCTRVTLGLGMCKICTEAVHCVSSPLQAFWRWSPSSSPPSALKALSLLEAPFKPPSSPLKAFRRWSPFNSSPLEALSKLPSSPLQAPSKPPSPSEGFKPPSSPLEAPFKPPSSPLEAFRTLWSPLQAPFKPPSSLSKPPSPSESFKPPSSPLEAPLKPPSSPLEAPFKPPSSPPFRRWSPWSLPKVKPPSSLREGCLRRVLRWRWSPIRHWRVPFLKVPGTFLDERVLLTNYWKIGNSPSTAFRRLLSVRVGWFTHVVTDEAAPHWQAQ